MWRERCHPFILCQQSQCALVQMSYQPDKLQEDMVTSQKVKNVEESVKWRKQKTLTETDSPGPSLQNTHNCVLVLNNIFREYLKIWNRSGPSTHTHTRKYAILVFVIFRDCTPECEWAAHKLSCSSSWVWRDRDVSNCITKKSSRKMFGTRFSENT